MALTKSEATLSGIPAELRRDIFKYALSTESKIQVSSNPILRLHKKDRITAQLLSVSKGFKHEGTPLMYAKKVWAFKDLEAAAEFVERIGDVNSTFITQLECRRFWFKADRSAMYPSLEEDAAVYFEQQCPQLTKLSISEMYMPCIDDEKRDLSVLRYFLRSLPALQLVMYSDNCDAMILSKNMVDEGNMAAAGYRVVDIEEIMQDQAMAEKKKAKEKAIAEKEKRSAAARRGAATRKARNAGKARQQSMNWLTESDSLSDDEF